MKFKLLNFIRKILSVFLIFAMLSTEFTVFALPDDSATERQASFLNFYKNASGLELNMSNLTLEDYYTLYVFMSNWFEPGVTTLQELTEVDNGNSNFFNSFTADMKITDSNAQKMLSDIIIAIAADTVSGLESGICTLSTKNGKIMTGLDLLDNIVNSVNISEGKFEKSKVYFNNGGNETIDFSSEVYRSAFEILASYNPALFLDKDGLESLDILFIDAVGNIWGAEAGANKDTIIDSINFKNLVSKVGANNVYLIMPACLNPATFSVGASDMSELRMPLMNRYVLGNILDIQEFVNSSKIGTVDLSLNSSEGVDNGAYFTFLEKAIPFYNLFTKDTAGSMGGANTGLSIFGVHSMTPLIMNSGIYDAKGGEYTGAFNWTHEWSSSDRIQQIANFLYDPNMISINRNVTNGVGKFGTYSYIVFAPNYASVDNNSSDDKTNSDTENRALDMQTNFLWWKTTEAYSVFSSDGNVQKMEKQKELIYYLFTPTILSLNNVSMSFYYQAAQDSVDGDAVSESIAYQIYGYTDTDELVASKMGMRGLDLFMSVSTDGQQLDDGLYSCMRADRMIPSYMTYQLISKNSTYHDINLYDSIKSCTQQANGKAFIESKVEDSELADWVNETIYWTGAGFDVKDTWLSLITDKGNYSEVGKDSLEGYTAYLMHPRKITNVGTENIGVNDVAFGKTLGVKDITLRSSLSSLSANIKNDASDVDTKRLAGVDSNGDRTVGFWNDLAFVGLLLSFFQYSLFGPSEATLRAISPETSFRTGKLLGTDKDFTACLYLSKFGYNQEFAMGIYFGYIIDMMGISYCAEDGLSFGGFSSKYLPKYSISARGGNLSYSYKESDSGVLVGEDTSFEQKQKDLIDRIYGLTNDSNNDYRNSLIKTILEGFFLTVHRTITGTWGSSISSISTGDSSTYQSLTGYIYTPTLDELSFTSNVMNNYIKIYIFCMILILFLMILMVLLNMRTWQQGILITLVMFIALLFPYILVSNSINISNKISNSIYSDRFDFWALSEHQRSLRTLTNVAAMNEKDRLLSISSATADTTYGGNAGVKIKWMSPKKVDMFQSLYSDSSLSESFVTNMQIFKWLFNSFVYDSEFVDTDVYGSFLYRSYNTISLEAGAYYDWSKYLMQKSNLNSGTETLTYNGYNFSDLPSNVVNSISLLDGVNGIEPYTFTALLATIDNNYYRGGSGGVDYSSEGQSISGSRVTRYSDIQTVKGKNSNRDSNSIAILGDLSTTVSKVASELSNITDVSIKSGSSIDVGQGVVSNLPLSADGEYFKNRNASVDEVSKAIFLKNTESPYYYFYTVLKYKYSSDTNSESFRQQLLQSDLFRISDKEQENLRENIKAQGAVRDFLDLEGLFTSVIPYMKVCNDYVFNWRAVNGFEIESYNFDYTIKENGIVDATALSEVASKDGAVREYEDAVYLKNAQNKVWNMYSPWVDSLYDLNVYNAKVTVGNKRLYIMDSLNPSSYLEVGRPMIFSEADMIAKGYNYSSLTDVEKRIQEVLDKTYLDMLYLVNYYDMGEDDMGEDVLLSAAAMYATFNFNEVFSDAHFLGNSVMLYPQGFELKNFNYDAFMRLALLNATGEDIVAEDDLYTRVLSKTSIFTGLILIICDFVACILIPLLKFIIVIGIFFLGILLCITIVVNPPEKIFEAILKSIVLPDVIFMIMNILFAWVMSLIIGEGLTANVGSRTVNFATNDPTLTMLLMAGLGIVYVFFAIKLVKMLIQSYKEFGMNTFLTTVGLIGTAFKTGASKVGNFVAGATGGLVGGGIGAVMAGVAGRSMVEGATLGVKGNLRRNWADKQMRKNLAEGLGGKQSVTDGIDAKAASKGDGTEGLTENKPKLKGSSEGNVSATVENKGARSQGSKSNSSGEKPGVIPKSSAQKSSVDSLVEQGLAKKSVVGSIGAGAIMFGGKVQEGIESVKHGFRQVGSVWEGRKELASRVGDKIKDKTDDFAKKVKSVPKYLHENGKEYLAKKKAGIKAQMLDAHTKKDQSLLNKKLDHAVSETKIDKHLWGKEYADVAGDERLDKLVKEEEKMNKKQADMTADLIGTVRENKQKQSQRINTGE